jgi:hypothetical protein
MIGVNEMAITLGYWLAALAALAIIVTARLRETAPPASVVLEQIRENALRSILSSETKG